MVCGLIGGLEHAARCRHTEAHQRARWSATARRLRYRQFAGKVVRIQMSKRRNTERARARVAAPLSLVRESVGVRRKYADGARAPRMLTA